MATASSALSTARWQKVSAANRLRLTVALPPARRTLCAVAASRATLLLSQHLTGYGRIEGPTVAPGGERLGRGGLTMCAPPNLGRWLSFGAS